MELSKQPMTIWYTQLMVLVMLLTQTVCSYAMSSKAQQLFSKVESANWSLFKIKTEQLPTGATRSISFKTLQNQYPGFDPLLSDVERNDLAERLQAWNWSITQAAGSAGFLKKNTFNDKTLEQALEAYRATYMTFSDILTTYRDTVQKKQPLASIVPAIKQAINSPAMLAKEKAMNQARRELDKEFGRLTRNREGKNSTRTFLISLIDILNQNIHTVRKRVFELDRELRG